MKVARRSFLLRAGSLCALGALGGCASLVGANEPQPDTFELFAPDAISVRRRLRGVQLLIAEPSALKALDSQNIVVRDTPASIQYLGLAQWADRLPKVVQQRLFEAFENANAFGGVGLPGQGLAIDYQLIVSIRAFEIRPDRANAAVIELSAKLLNDRNGTVRAQKLFSTDAPAVDGTNRGYVDALNVAFGKAVTEIVAWTAANA